MTAAGAWPDGIVVDDTAYWTTMGRPSLLPGMEGEQGADFSARTGARTRHR